MLREVNVVYNCASVHASVKRWRYYKTEKKTLHLHISCNHFKSNL